MASKRKRRNRELCTEAFDAFRSVRKPMPPKTRVLNPKKAYDRKDKSWLNPDND